MLFGIPWPGIVAIVAIVGGLLYAYKEKEMELEGKRLGKSRELNEMRQIVHSLKSRVDSLEAKISMFDEKTSNQEKNPLNDIEIEDEVEGHNNDNGTSRTKSRA
jgi:hypothetical protein